MGYWLLSSSVRFSSSSERQYFAGPRGLGEKAYEGKKESKWFIDDNYRAYRRLVRKGRGARSRERKRKRERERERERKSERKKERERESRGEGIKKRDPFRRAQIDLICEKNNHTHTLHIPVGFSDR